MKSKESHNLDVMHLGCCTGCGGTHIIPTQFTQPAGVAPPVSNEAIETVHEKSLRLLREFLKNEPEEAKRIMKEVEAMGFEGPTVEEYFNLIGYVSNEASRTPVKVYSREQMESAIEHFSKYVEKYGFIPSTELVNMYLSGIKNSLISVREINHLLSSIPTPSTDEGMGD